jgi:hypothetical protein
MNILRPFTGIRVFQDCWTPEQCSRYVAHVESVRGWEAAAMGQYQDDVVVKALVDKNLRDVDVLNFEDVNIDNPLSTIPNLLALINSELECEAERISRSMISRYTYGNQIKPHKDTGVHSRRLSSQVIRGPYSAWLEAYS